MKTLGFVVTANDAPLELTLPSNEPGMVEIPKKGILMWGYNATLFVTKRAANAAIKRTQAYTEKRGLKWTNGYNVVPAVPEQ